MLKALLFGSFLLSQHEKGPRLPGETGGLPPQARSLTAPQARTKNHSMETPPAFTTSAHFLRSFSKNPENSTGVIV